MESQEMKLMSASRRSSMKECKCDSTIGDVVIQYNSNIPSKEEVYRMAHDMFGHVKGKHGATLKIAYWLGLTDMKELLTNQR